MNHIRITGCSNQCGECNFCCLYVCKYCLLYEGSLTTDCPIRPPIGVEADKVYNGEIDFRDGHWMEGTSPHCPKGQQQYAKHR